VDDGNDKVMMTVGKCVYGWGAEEIATTKCGFGAGDEQTEWSEKTRLTLAVMRCTSNVTRVGR